MKVKMMREIEIEAGMDFTFTHVDNYIDTEYTALVMLNETHVFFEEDDYLTCTTYSNNMAEMFIDKGYWIINDFGSGMPFSNKVI